MLQVAQLFYFLSCRDAVGKLWPSIGFPKVLLTAVIVSWLFGVLIEQF